MLIRLIQLPRKFTNFKIETIIMHFVQLWVQSKLDKMDMVQDGHLSKMDNFLYTRKITVKLL